MVLWKKERLHSTISKYICGSVDINTITSVYFTNSDFKILTQVPVSVLITLFTPFIFSPTSLDSSGDKNLFHHRTCSGTSDFFLLTESLRVVTEEKECILGGFYSLECPLSGQQMF